MNYETIQEFYTLGLWDKSQLQKLVLVGALTQDQFNTITEAGSSPVMLEVNPVG